MPISRRGTRVRPRRLSTSSSPDTSRGPTGCPPWSCRLMLRSKPVVLSRITQVVCAYRQRVRRSAPGNGSLGQRRPATLWARVVARRSTSPTTSIASWLPTIDTVGSHEARVSFWSRRAAWAPSRGAGDTVVRCASTASRRVRAVRHAVRRVRGHYRRGVQLRHHESGLAVARRDADGGVRRRRHQRQSPQGHRAFHLRGCEETRRDDRLCSVSRWAGCAARGHPGGHPPTPGVVH